MHDRSYRRRRSVARSVERVAVPERPYVGRGPRYLIKPDVALACAPSLHAIATALRDVERQIDDEHDAAVLAFVTSFDSPLRGVDPAAAGTAAALLERSVADTAIPTGEPVTALAA